MGCGTANVLEDTTTPSKNTFVEGRSSQNDKFLLKNTSDKRIESLREKEIQELSKNEKKINETKKSFLGINIGALKTVYSIFSETNGKYVSNVLLMNNSSRIIPSIICYTNENRLIGENAKSYLKQNLSTSYNNLSRIIDTEIKEEEKKFFFSDDFKFNCYNKKKEKEEIKQIYIIADYLSIINKYYSREGLQYDFTCLSVPDFYNDKYKENLTLICESIGMKNIKIYNESSAITMYYGYTKYRDLFVQEKNEVDPTIEKNILFIDIGYSKTSFILSYFKYNKFEVKYVKTYPEYGGRYFDNIIAEYCIEEFKNEKNLPDIEITNKMLYKLLEVIAKKRIQLTINNETNFLVDAFYEDQDLNIILSKKDYDEKIIKDFSKKFSDYLDLTIKYSKEKKIKIDYVEIAGEFMRTPILQSIIENTNLKICKTILIDECTSVGAALLGSFFNGKFPIKQLKSFNHINNNNINIKNSKNSDSDFMELKKKIKEHIKMQNEIDERYNKFINEKSAISKFLYSVKNLVEKNKKYNNKLLEINNIERKLRKIEIDMNDLKDINKKLKEINSEITKDLYNTKNNELTDKLNQFKKNKNNKFELNDIILDFEEKIENLKNENIETFIKYEKIIGIEKEIDNSKLKAIEHIENK